MDRKQWLAKRREGLGASDISTIFGLNRWQSSVGLWGIKTGLKDSFEGNEATRTGELLEPYVLSLLASHTGYELADGLAFARHADWSAGCRLQVNTDGHLIGPAGSYVAEVKTAGSDPGSVYLSYWLQVQACLCATVGAGAWLGFLYGPRDRKLWFAQGWELSDLLCFKAWFIPPCPHAQGIMQVGVARWWRYVTERTPPDGRGIAGGVRLMALWKEWQKSPAGQPVPADWRQRGRVVRTRNHERL